MAGRASLIVTLGIAFAACDGTAMLPAPTDDPDGGPPATVSAQIAASIAQAVCAKIDECCPGGERTQVAGAGADRAECERNMGAFYGRQYTRLDEVVAQSLATFDAAALAECTQTYIASGCQAPAFTARMACRRALAGVSVMGQTCQSGFECTSRLCPRQSADQPGMCGAHKRDGESCSNDRECASGLCTSVFLSSVCGSMVPPGRACGGDGFWLTL